ncbi:hypothetical protein [Anaeroselena agilis]|uniref:YD repeat-containing protein n=1 Tax=Anaeroselena agilis TaxID=3063788 RepID=A0ABU3P185_9FIRM|nr:hypothetical protein [Selenomonadales bacterium 4137-cl]
MKTLFRTRILALLLAVFFVAALPCAALAAERLPQRIPAGLFNLFLSDELQGPLYGPVKKVTVKSGESYWAASFDRGGKPLSREQFIPGFTNEQIAYEAGRPAKRVENAGTDKQTVYFVHYDPAGRGFKLLAPALGGKMAELGSGTTDGRGLVTAKTIRYAEGVLYDAAYEYNPAGLVTRETSRLTKRGTVNIERVYDKSGRILSRLFVSSPQPDGPATAESTNKLEYRYDLSGRLTDAFYQSDKPAATVTLSVKGEYDKHGNWTRLVMTRRDANGQASSQTFTQEIEYY